MERNMTGNTRKKMLSLLFAFAFFLLTFLSVIPVKAISDPPPDALYYTQSCGEAPQGKKYAIFGRTIDENFPPAAQPAEFCLLVDSAENFASFNRLMTNHVLDIGWRESGVVEEIWRCGPAQFSPESPSQTPAESTSFNFTSKKRVECPNTRNARRNETQDDVPTRYKIYAPTGTIYLYFLGIFNQPGSTLSRPCSEYTKDGSIACSTGTTCFWFPKPDATNGGTCESKLDRTLCSALPQSLCGSDSGSPACAWNRAIGRCISALEDKLGQEHAGTISKTLPPCSLEGTCRDTNDLLQLVVNYVKYFFGFIGSIALAFFVYGGFTIVVSMGNAEGVKKGRDIIAAAVIGIIICFSAYVAIDFMLDALQVEEEFRGIGTYEKL